MNSLTHFKSDQGKREIFKYYDLRLNKIAGSYEKIRLDTKCGKTFALAAGDKRAFPIVLLHGRGINASMWVEDIARLSKSYRVYAPDMPGQPGRSEDRFFSFSSEDYVEWLFDATSLLEIDEMIIAGESIGGWLAAKFAMKRPKNVRKLILVAPHGFVRRKKSVAAMQAVTRAAKDATAKFFMDNPRRQPMEDCLLAICRNYYESNEQVPIFKDGDLRKLTMPCMVVVESSESFSMLKRLDALLPDLKFHALQNYRRQPSGFCDEVMKFLDS
ncbi:MAG: alpha/beta fold hydrolase [Clostridiales bacterium]|nr:alpha/beta fold hydrolase [Clostridiales bacterium]